MTSNDNQQFVTVEMFNAGINRLETRILRLSEQQEQARKETQSETLAVRDIALVNSAKLDAYKDFTSLWFAGIAILVALIGFIGTLAPMFRDMYKESKQERKDKSTQLSREDVQNMIDATVEQAIAKALGNLGK